GCHGRRGRGRDAARQSGLRAHRAAGWRAPDHRHPPARHGSGARARRTAPPAASMTWQIIAAIAVFAIAYVLIVIDRIPRVTIALGGAAVMILIGATDDHGIFYSETTGIDWNVVFLLLGMMIIVGILR